MEIEAIVIGKLEHPDHVGAVALEDLFISAPVMRPLSLMKSSVPAIVSFLKRIERMIPLMPVTDFAFFIFQLGANDQCQITHFPWPSKYSVS
ncbi:MAG: hypothetical protein R3D29_03890 [Nitratireductor sp.]